jgi:hypothetical protein
VGIRRKLRISLKLTVIPSGLLMIYIFKSVVNKGGLALYLAIKNTLHTI